MSWWWSLYLNWCVAASTLEALETLGGNVYITLEPILLKLGGGRYVRPIILGTLSELLWVGVRAATLVAEATLARAEEVQSAAEEQRVAAVVRRLL